MGTGYWEEEPGIKSNSRMTGSIVIYYALLLVAYVVIAGLHNGETVIIVAASAGTLFTTIAGPSMYFIYKQKQTEADIITKTPPTNEKNENS